MTRPPRILDASAIVALFGGHDALLRLLNQAEQGHQQLLLPTAAIAEAERRLRAGTGGWEAILLTPGVRSLPLTELAMPACRFGRLSTPRSKAAPGGGGSPSGTRCTRRGRSGRL